MTEPITDPIGRRTYSPTEEACRKAPAFCCAIASRIVRLREAIRLKKNYRMEDLTGPLPFESEFLSSDISQVNSAFERSSAFAYEI